MPAGVVSEGISPGCISNGFEGCDDSLEAYLTMCKMEYEGILERRGEICMRRFILSKKINPDYTGEA